MIFIVDQPKSRNINKVFEDAAKVKIAWEIL